MALDTARHYGIHDTILKRAAELSCIVDTWSADELNAAAVDYKTWGEWDLSRQQSLCQQATSHESDAAASSHGASCGSVANEAQTLFAETASALGYHVNSVLQIPSGEYTCAEPGQGVLIFCGVQGYEPPPNLGQSACVYMLLFSSSCVPSASDTGEGHLDPPRNLGVCTIYGMSQQSSV